MEKERTTPRVRVSTTFFEFSHGRKPRGRGLWLFELSGCSYPRVKEVVEVNGNYAAAKATAVRLARAGRYAVVKVLP